MLTRLPDVDVPGQDGGAAAKAHAIGLLIARPSSIVGSGIQPIAAAMMRRTEARFGLKPRRPAPDSADGSAPMLNWLVEEKQITPHIPVIDKSHWQRNWPAVAQAGP